MLGTLTCRGVHWGGLNSKSSLYIGEGFCGTVELMAARSGALRTPELLYARFFSSHPDKFGL